MDLRPAPGPRDPAVWFLPGLQAGRPAADHVPSNPRRLRQGRLPAAAQHPRHRPQQHPPLPFIQVGADLSQVGADLSAHADHLPDRKIINTW